MTTKFSVFFGFRAVKTKAHRENFRDRCKVIEWESLQVWTSCVSMRARKKQNTSWFSVLVSCCGQLTCAVHVAPEFDSRPEHLFSVHFFQFFFVFSPLSGFLGTLAARIPNKTCALPATKVWHRWVSLSSSKSFFFEYEFFKGRMTRFFCIFTIFVVFHTWKNFWKIFSSK